MTELGQIADREEADKADRSLVRLFRDRSGHDEVFELLADVRQQCPVHHSNALGQWVLTSYDGVKRALQDRRFAVVYAEQMDVRRPDWRDHPALAQAADTMLMIDGPEHDRVRRIGLSKMNLRLVQRRSDHIQAVVDGILEPFLAKAGGDFMAEAAFPITMTVISDLMGMPREDRDWYRHDVIQRILAFDASATEEDLVKADEAALRIRTFWLDLVNQRLDIPADDLVSDLLHAPDVDDRLSAAETATFCDFLFGAGFDTTVNTLGLGVLAFAENPDQFARLRADSALTQTMVEEVLRYTSVIVSQARFTAEGVEVGSQEIPPGQVIMCALAAANRDPAAYIEPDRFDIGREGPPNLTFGFGRHMCLGAPLARAEIRMVFSRLAERATHIRLACPRSDLKLEPRLSPRGLVALPIVLDLSLEAARP